jgi:hypothetical protein
MSALPAQVKKHIDRANQLIEQINAQPEADPNAQPAPADPAQPAAQQPSPQPEAAPAQQPNFEQQYRVLQGKYNAEMPRMQAQIRELMGANRALQEQVTATNALLASLGGQAQRPASGSPASSQPVKLVKDEEIREYGADLLDVVRRAAQEAVLPELDRRIEQRVQPVAQRVETVATQASSTAQRIVKQDQAAVHEMLTDQVPNWKQMDTDDGFNNWLDQKDPFSGRVRGEMLNEAYRAHDAPRVVAFFKSYLNENAAVTPPASGNPAAQGASPQTRLEDMVVPGTPKTGAAGAQDGANNKRIWSRNEITKFYHDKQQGLYRSDPKKSAAIEADIFSAQREGRIR